MKKLLLLIILGAGALIGGYVLMTHKAKYVKQASPYDDLIQAYADKYSVDPLLIRAIIQQESAWDPDVPGEDGLSIGLMQPTLATAHDFFGYDVTFDDIKDPDTNIHIGVWDFDRWRTYLAERGETSLEAQIASYNEGPGNWFKGKHDVSYVQGVIGYYNLYRGVSA